MPGTLARQRPGIGDPCLSDKMATPLNSLFFVLNISFLSNYCVKYSDNIVKLCVGVECNSCVPLDTVVLIVALMMAFPFVVI